MAPGMGRWCAARTFAAAVLLAAVCRSEPAVAADLNDALGARITPDVLGQAFPGADAIGEITGSPPSAPVLLGGDIIGHLFSTYDSVQSTGFAGEPFDIIVGVDLEANLVGVVLVEHHEPIIGPSMIRGDLMQGFLDRLISLSVVHRSRRTQRGELDGVSGATVSSKLMRSAVLTSAQQGVRKLGLASQNIDARGLAVDLDFYVERGWKEMAAIGDIAHLALRNGDVAAAFSGAATKLAALDADARFVDVYATLATPAGIGRNLLHRRWHNFAASQVGLGDHILSVAATGRYRVLGSAQPVSGGFDRIAVVQGDKIFRLGYDQKLKHTPVRAHGAPRFKEQALFRLKKRDGFDPLAPWSLRIFVEAGAVGAPRGTAAAVFDLPYLIPAAFVSGEEYALEEAGFREPAYALFGLVRLSTLNDWQQVWYERRIDIAILGGLLLGLTLILLFQNAITRHRRVHETVRIAFLAVVLVWLGWIKDAQLTSINIITYIQAFFRDMDPVLFLLDPLIFILSVYVGVSLILWGRGVFCGWLCPFGALQELLARLARAARVPQIAVPDVVQERLWVVKYIAVFVVFGLAVFSMDAAQVAAEVEPFKTAIIVGLDRSWPYLLYAGILLGLGLTIERFFCRYLCPLGGALAILGRARLLHWLKRRPQCGNPCNVCQASCPVGAIKDDGVIDMNECYQCLDCQVDYYDDHVCPPLVARRKRLERLVEAPATIAAE